MMKQEEILKTPHISMLLIFFFGVFILALRPIEAFDTFWQLQSGKHVWQTGAFIYTDTFSLAGEMFRMEHCWLHDLVLFVLYAVGGYPFLALLKPLTIALSGALLLWWNLKVSGQRVVLLPVLLLCLIASVDSWLVRPQMWTFLFGVLYMVLLYQGRSYRWKTWIWLVPLMLLWANLHAACILGFALIGAFWVGEVWRLCRREIERRDLIQLTSIGLLVFAAAFINPYGYRIPLGQLLGHLNQVKVITGSAPIGMSGNMEWLPPTLEQAPWFYAVMAAWTLTILLRLVRRNLDVAELVFFLGFSYMGFSQIRHTTLVALLAGFFLPHAMAVLFPRLEVLNRNLWLKLAPGLACLCAMIVLAWHQGKLGTGLRDFEFPVSAANFVEQHSPPGNLYNAYDWGGYLMWRLYPDYLVFVDGRSTSPHYFRASSQVENSWEGWEQTLLDEQVNLIVTRTCFYDTGGPQNLIDRLARNRDWALVFQDETAVVYVRRIPQNSQLIAEKGKPNYLAYRTMLAEAGRLQDEGYPRPRTWLALGRAHFGLGQTSEALQAFRNYLETAPGDREARMMVQLLSGRRN